MLKIQLSHSHSEYIVVCEDFAIFVPDMSRIDCKPVSLEEG